MSIEGGGAYPVDFIFRPTRKRVINQKPRMYIGIYGDLLVQASMS